MPNVIFIILPEYGHLFASFNLARKFQACGYKVVYFSPLRFTESIIDQGFEPLDIDAAGFPGTYPGESQGYQPYEQLSLGKIIPLVRQYQQDIHLFWNPDRLCQEIHRVIKVDFMVIDAILPMAAFTAHLMKIPYVVFSNLLPQEYSSNLPPPTSFLPHGDSKINRLQKRLSWASLQAKRSLKNSLAGLFGIDIRIQHWVAEYARQVDFPQEKIDYRAAFTPVLDVPTLVACPKAFDYPGVTRSTLHYIEPGIDFQRKQTDSSQLILPGKPLLYCSLGSQGHAHRLSRKVYHAVIEFARRMPSWQVIIAHVAPQNLHVDIEIPANVQISSMVPQLEILKNARVVITHGGLGTIKECIWFRVPMIVVPFDRDQPGNAQRVSNSGCGKVVRPSRITPNKLYHLILSLDQDPYIRQKLAELSQVFHQAEEQNLSLFAIRELFTGIVSSSMREAYE